MTASRGIGRLYGDDHPRARLTAEIVRRMRLAAQGGEAYAAIAEREGLPRRIVIDAITGVTWPSVDDPPPVTEIRREPRWTAADLAALAASDEPAPVVARRLGRTPHAVRQQRYKRAL